MRGERSEVRGERLQVRGNERGWRVIGEVDGSGAKEGTRE